MNKVGQHAIDLASSIIANQNIPSDKFEELRDHQVEKPQHDCVSFDLTINVTNQITELYNETTHKMPWQSFSISNEGPSPVFYSVNRWLDPQAGLPVGQSSTFDSQTRDGIKRIFLKCDAGLTTRVTINAIK